MNRPPGKSDTWWAKHEEECGGTYTKIQEPELTKKQRDALSAKERAGLQKNKLDSWVKVGSKKGARPEGKTSDNMAISNATTHAPTSTSGLKRKAEIIVIDDVVASAGSKRSRSGTEDKTDQYDENLGVGRVMMDLVECPICNQQVAEPKINEHLDTVHP